MAAQAPATSVEPPPVAPAEQRPKTQKPVAALAQSVPRKAEEWVFGVDFLSNGGTADIIMVDS
eukprot:4902200-Alexandrium_andersonii.AAC.1